MSNLVDHATRELDFAGVEEDVRPSIIAAVEAFASYGHSGGSASVCIPLLNDLLSFRNIGPLTDAPAEWMDVSRMTGDAVLYQSRRNPEAFSLDGGRTYYLLSEERRWIPRSIRRRLRKHSEYLVYPRHRTTARV